MAEFLKMSSGGFQLGLDWSKNPESIPDGALVQAENCEYNHADGALRTVAGVRIKLDAGTLVDTLFYDHRHSVFYFSSGSSLYRSDLVTKTFLGSLAGPSRPVYAMFGDVCLVASGGLLQAIAGSNSLQTIAGSPPVSHYVTTRMGRVLAYSIASDVLNYSGIGDHTNWTKNTNDPSSARYVDVGYKDPGNIISIDFLSRVIMVYKAGGRAYKIVGEPNDSNFAVEPVSQTASCLSMMATENVDDKSFYLGQAGLMSFQPVNTYGNVAPAEEGLNINAWLAKNIDANCQLWHVQSRKQLWLKCQNDKRIYLYHYIPRYSDGRGAFTVRTFKYQLSDVCCVGSDVYVAYGNKIGMLDESIDLDDDMQIQTVVTGNNKLTQRHAILIMAKNFVAKNIVAGYGTVQIGRKTISLSFLASSKKVYGNKEKVFDNKTKVVNSDYTRMFKVGGGSQKSVQVKVIVQKGSVAIRQLDYDYLEV